MLHIYKDLTNQMFENKTAQQFFLEILAKLLVLLNILLRFESLNHLIHAQIYWNTLY